MDSLMVFSSDTASDSHLPFASDEGTGGAGKNKMFLRLFLQNERRLRDAGSVQMDYIDQVCPFSRAPEKTVTPSSPLRDFLA